MAAEYVCEYGGYAGRDEAADDVDRIRCRMCSELVVPSAPGSGLVDS